MGAVLVAAVARAARSSLKSTSCVAARHVGGNVGALDCEPPSTRKDVSHFGVDAGPVEAFFLSPFNINYHTAHHLFPSVPWYNLPALHERLLEDSAYASRLVSAPSYTGPGGVFDELTRDDTAPVAIPAL